MVSPVSVVRGLNASSSSGMATMVGSQRVGSSSASNAGYQGSTNERGEPHGDGCRTFSSGHVYDGQWVDGRCHGFGTFTYPDGQVFEGEWSGGRRNGPGKLSMPSGETIAGTWVNDTLSGEVRRWNTVEEAPPAPVRPQDRVVVNRPGASPSGAPPAQAAADADVEWLKESHDVVWQLNVELQMENERLVAENRRLRLKLRQLLQTQNGPNQAGGCQNCQGNCNQGNKNCKGHGSKNCGCDDCKDKEHEAPKVVEGKLRRKKKEKSDKGGGGMDAALIAKLLGGSGQPDCGHSQGAVAEYVMPMPVSEDEGLDPAEKRRRIAEELCERAEKELKEQLRQPRWESIKRLDKAGEVERYAKHMLKNFLKRVRDRRYDDRRALSEAANDVKDALAAVVNWPDGLQSMTRRCKLDEHALLRTAELRLDGCRLGPGGAGAACVLLRASRQLRTLDLGSNGLGDVGATMLADALRTSTPLQKLRLSDNGIGAAGGGALGAMLTTNHDIQRVDLRGNRFDALSEAALRQAGGKRVLLTEREVADAGDFLNWGSGSGGPAVQPQTAGAPRQDADAFLSFAGGSSSPPPPPPPPRASRDASAFLASVGGTTAQPSSGSADADAFINFGETAPRSGGDSGGGDSNEAAAFINFAGGNPSSSAAKSSLSSSSSGKRVTFPAAASSSSGGVLGAMLGQGGGNTCNASDLFGD